jgi:hypothetical protein
VRVAIRCRFKKGRFLAGAADFMYGEKMGSRLRTEAEIEDYLQQEVRGVPMPDGSIRNLQHFGVTWANYDLALRYGPLSAVEISALALFRAERKDVPFEVALADVLIPLRQRCDDILDRRIAARERRISLRNQFRADFNAAWSGAVASRRPPKPHATTSTPLVFRTIVGD